MAKLLSGTRVYGNLTIDTFATATGNVTGGNLVTAGQVTATGNVTGGNLTTGGIVSATGNVSGSNLLLSGNIFDSGASLQINTTTSANIALAPNQTIVLTATTTGANITGTLNATGNANVGNIGATNAVSTNFVTGGNVLSKFSTVTTSVANSQVTLDSWSGSTYRSGRYYCQVTSGSNYQVIELSMVHDAANVYLTQYGEIVTNTSLGNFDASYSGGTVSVLFTPVNAVSTVKASATLISV